MFGVLAVEETDGRDPLIDSEIKFVVSLLTEIFKCPPTLPSILKEDNTGAIFMAKNTAIGQRTKHVDNRYRFVNDMILSNELSVEHIRSGDNPSDTMTKNLPLALFVKHAAVISEGLLGTLYDPQNTEDVESYSATVEYNGGTGRRSNATMLVAPYTWDNCSYNLCSAALLDVSDWTEVTKKSKPRRSGRPPSMQDSTEGFLVGLKVKE